MAIFNMNNKCPAFKLSLFILALQFFPIPPLNGKHEHDFWQKICYFVNF